MLMISFITAMLESTVIQVSKNQKRLDADQGIYSVFGEYQRDLLEEYEIFAVEGSYESGEFTEQRLIDRMQYFGASSIAQEITGIQFLTDSGGRAYREAAVKFMEDTYGLSFIQDLTGMPAEWEEQEIQGENAEAEDTQIRDELDEILQENESTLPAENNPLPQIEELKKTGILKLVFPKDRELSGKSINRQDQPSSRTLRRGRGSFPVRADIDGAVEKLLFHEYILEKFGNAVEEKADNRSLSYEVEYILNGEDSDKDNLEAAVNKILLIRTGLNYAYLLTDSVKQAEAETAALGLSSLVGLPIASGLVKQALLAAWAFGEGIMDLRSLLEGKKAAVVKSSETWQLSLSNLMNLVKGEDLQEGSDTEGGIDYKGYLRVLLFLENSEEVTMRAIDRTEQNLIYEKELSYFRADACVTKLRVKNTAEIRSGLSYEFPLYFGYE